MKSAEHARVGRPPETEFALLKFYTPSHHAGNSRASRAHIREIFVLEREEYITEKCFIRYSIAGDYRLCRFDADYPRR